MTPKPSHKTLKWGLRMHLTLHFAHFWQFSWEGWDGFLRADPEQICPQRDSSCAFDNSHLKSVMRTLPQACAIICSISCVFAKTMARWKMVWKPLVCYWHMFRRQSQSRLGFGQRDKTGDMLRLLVSPTWTPSRIYPSSNYFFNC